MSIPRCIKDSWKRIVDEVNKSMDEWNPYNKTDFILIVDEILDNAHKQPNCSMNISDLGNVIGHIVAKYFKDSNGKEEFINGINHGISLVERDYKI